MKTLDIYIKELEAHGLIQECHIPERLKSHLVTDVSYNSKDIDSGGLFVCKGAHFSPEYLMEAIRRGAVCYLSETRWMEAGEDFPFLLVSDVRRAMALLGNIFFDQAWNKLDLIGVTGTKGKSTTAYYIKYILDGYLAEAGEEPCAILSGIDVEDGVIFEESHLTTPEALMLHRHMHNAVCTGRKMMVMEVSSQALKYDRTLGIEFTVGCFLNIGEDHISPVEHLDFYDYFQSKLRLFGQSKKSCINLDMDRAEAVLQTAVGKTEVITFGMTSDAEIYATDVVSGSEGIQFTVHTPRESRKISLKMTGLFNVENALAAISACGSLGVPLSTIEKGLSVAQVPGRMETFLGAISKVLVIVDYAHNQMSFQRLYDSTAKEYPERDILAIFGCPGNKALRRRKELADVAAAYAKKIIITEEDAGEESLDAINQEIADNLKRQGAVYEIIPDRREAIRKAIAEADEKTVILLTGKGRETRQKRGTAYVDCPSDVDYVLEFLK